MQMRINFNYGTLGLDWSVHYQWLMNGTKALASGAGASGGGWEAKQTETTQQASCEMEPFTPNRVDLRGKTWQKRPVNFPHEGINFRMWKWNNVKSNTLWEVLTQYISEKKTLLLTKLSLSDGPGLTFGAGCIGQAESFYRKWAHTWTLLLLTSENLYHTNMGRLQLKAPRGPWWVKISFKHCKVIQKRKNRWDWIEINGWPRFFCLSLAKCTWLKQGSLAHRSVEGHVIVKV